MTTRASLCLTASYQRQHQLKMENVPKHWRPGQLSCATNTVLCRDLSTLTKIWQRLVLAVEFGLRQSTSSVGGISARQSEDGLKETCLPHYTTLSTPLVSIHSSMPTSSPMVAQIQMTVKGVFLGRSVSNGRRQRRSHPPVKTQIRSRSESRSCTCFPARLFGVYRRMWLHRYLPVVALVHRKL
jgi:hypothetical protein